MAITQFIVAGSLIDGSGSGVRKNIFLEIKDGIITAIGPAAKLPCIDEAAISDFSHCTILPTLVDSSVSLSRSPSLDQGVRLSIEESSFAQKAAMVEQHINYCHAHGVHGVADSNDTHFQIHHYLKEMAQGSIIDIRTSDRLCQSSEDCADGNSIGGDFLKIGYSANIEDHTALSPRLSPKELGHILQNRGNKKAVVVANGPQQVKEAIEAGSDAIEQGYAMGEDNLRHMAEKKVLWIPNVLRAKNSLDGAGGSDGEVGCRFSQRYVAEGKPDPGAEDFWKKILTDQLTQLNFARKIGVTTAVGTGAGCVGILHGESMAEEMKLFIKAGYSLEETIRCASENGARFFGMRKLGMLTVGRNATFLITRGTPQQLPRKLSYLEGIYVDGVPSSIYSKNPVKPG